jgi:hypothetical protein
MGRIDLAVGSGARCSRCFACAGLLCRWRHHRSCYSELRWRLFKGAETLYLERSLAVRKRSRRRRRCM